MNASFFIREDPEDAGLALSEIAHANSIVITGKNAYLQAEKLDRCKQAIISCF